MEFASRAVVMQRTRAANARRALVAGAVVAVAAAVVLRLVSGEEHDLPAAAQRAEAYLRERGTKLDPAMLLILDYLDRRFGLAWVRPAVARAREQGRACADGRATTPAECRSSGTFVRLLDPTARLTPEQIAALPNTLDMFTANGLHCKANGLPPTFLQDVQRRLLKDDYDPGHAALGLQWAIEQGCLDAHSADVTALRERVIDDLVEVAAGVPRDAAIESIAMLAYVRAWSRVRSDWLQTIARAQWQDGGWGEHEKALLPNDHTTTLALWVLLEATREGHPVSWVAQ